MAFPTVESATGQAFASGTSHAVDMPATVNEGDLLLVIYTGADNASVATPTGWTSLFSVINTVRYAAFYKEAVGDEDGTSVDFVSATAHKAATIIFRVSGAATSPEATTATGSSTGPDSPSLTPSWGAADTLWIASFGAAFNVSVITWPNNYANNRVTQNTSAGGAATSVSASRDLNATSEDPTTFAKNIDGAWAAATIGIEPAAAGGGVEEAYAGHHLGLGI